MKWYETSLTAQFDNAIKLLQQGRSEAYVKAIRRICTLMIEREKQVRCDLEMTSVLSHYQGIDALLHMEQSKLRVMPDEDLSISRIDISEIVRHVYIWLRRHSEEAELRVWACWHRMHRCNQAVARLYREKRRRELSGVWNIYKF